MAGTNKDWFSKVILLKFETTTGVDATPTSAANALRVLEFQPNFMDAQQKVRNLELAYFGADPVSMSAFKRGASFVMEMAGAGTATGIPPWMIPLQLAGFGAPVVAANVTISPITAAIKTATTYFYIDDLLMIALGTRASVGFKIEDDEYPQFNFNLLGAPPTALASQAVPTGPTLTGYIDPVISSTENTTFTLDTYAVGLRRWSMDANVDLQYRSLINPVDRVNYRQRAWAGEIVIEVPDLTTKDYFAKIRPGTQMVGTAVQGNVVGNIVTVSAPKLQITGNVTLSEEQGKTMATLPVTALPNAGNDEITFVSS